MNETQFKELMEKIKADLGPLKAEAQKMAEDAIKNGGISKEKFEEYQAAMQKTTEKLDEICRKQGTTIQELQEKLQNGTGAKSLAQTLKEHDAEIKKVKSNGSGVKQFHVFMNTKGEWVAKPYDPNETKAGPHATVDDVADGSNVASITQSIDAATLLRIGGNAPIISQFRNSSWVFDLCNLQNASIDTPFAMWYEEQAKDGASATVLEGGTKPSVQYKYDLKSAQYKKEAMLIGVTDEWAIDFSRLQSDIIGKGRTDLINRVNSAVLANIITAATAYNSNSSFGTISDANDFDAIAAMAAQVDNATFGGNMANAAVMSTFKKYRMGIEKNGFGSYLNRPDVLAGINFVGNPAMSADNVLVGDFKEYNIILRGGFIVKVGYNGTDFAENRFSIVMEQYYYDYISNIRKVAIVKGTTFATVKGLINAGS